MNCSQQSSVVWTQFLHSNQSSARIRGGHFNTQVSVWRLSPSVPLIYLSRITFINEASIAPITSLPNLQRLILLISMGMDAVQSLNLCQGCRLLGMQLYDLITQTLPLYDHPCVTRVPSRSSATPAPRLQTRRRESGIRSNNYASDLLLAAGKVLCTGSQNNTNIFGVFPGLQISLPFFTTVRNIETRY